MRAIQRWRRIVFLVCFLMCVDALLVLWLDPGLQNTPHLALLQSLFFFVVALIVAVNYLSLRAPR